MNDIEMQEQDPQEGAGNGGGSGSDDWKQDLTLQIYEEAANLQPLDSSAPYLRRSSLSNTNEECPSIFRPHDPIVAPTATVDATVAAPVAQTATVDATVAAPGSRGPTGRNVVAVGPYHDESEQPAVITPGKKCAIVKFLSHQEFKLNTVVFFDWAQENDDRVRRCYEHGTFDNKNKTTEKDLAKMLLLDGCLVLFAIFLLSKFSVREGHKRPFPLRLLAEGSSRKKKPAEDSSNEKPKDSSKEKLKEDFTKVSADISEHMKQTRLDLLLLGNQVPFFVLEELHRQLKETLFEGINHSLQEIALSCFDDIRPTRSGVIKQDGDIRPTRNGFIKQDGEALSFHHLLHIFHWSRVPLTPSKHTVHPSLPSPLLGDPESNLPCATWFEDSHIGLSQHAAAPGTLHMAFERNMLGARGVLRVQALHIHDYSSLVFQNLIAFEQRHLRCGLAATTYSICMNGLLQSEADAKLLKKSGILAHTHETDKDIVDLFRGLAGECRRDGFYSGGLLDLCREVETHHHSTAARAAKWVARQCFPKQTLTFFVILGALISIATLINTIVSVYRFYHPYKQ